jgi:hypothetical protein
LRVCRRRLVNSGLTSISIQKNRTTIGYGSKNQGEEKVHGAPLGDADIAQVKSKFGFNPEEKFVVPQEVKMGFILFFNTVGLLTNTSSQGLRRV